MRFPDLFKHFRALFASQRASVRPPGDDLFFCHGDTDDCLLPRKLDQMLYGCVVCSAEAKKNPGGLLPADSLPQGVTATPEIFDNSSACAPHHLPIRPVCPVCHKLIERSDNARPIRFVAGPHSGKTVYSAVLAHEILKNRYFDVYHYTVSLVHGDGYLRSTVNPLFSDGIVPKKTSESHKALFRFARNGQKAELITLHDMSGEIALSAPLGFFSNKTLFVINPQAAAGLGGPHFLAGNVKGFVFDAVSDLVNTLQRLGCLDHATEQDVQVLVNRAVDLLNEEGFPYTMAGVLPPIRVAERLRHTALGLLGDCTLTPSDVDMLSRGLHAIAMGLADQPSFERQFDQWYEHMRRIGAPLDSRRERLLDHRLALIICKADLLQVHHHHDVIAPRITPEEINVLSSLNRAKFVNLGLVNLVTKAENAVEHVGFFFATALGRDTEIVVKKVTTQANQVSKGQSHMMSQPGVQPVDAQPVVEWQLTEKVTEGTDGLRRPSPVGVIDPLHWLLQ